MSSKRKSRVPLVSFRALAKYMEYRYDDLVRRIIPWCVRTNRQFKRLPYGSSDDFTITMYVYKEFIKECGFKEQYIVKAISAIDHLK